jgi:hypothetical protein
MGTPSHYSLLWFLNMNASKSAETFFSRIGKDTPKIILSAIAVNCMALATIRPGLTLLNPNESMERKKYAAMRESLSELIGMPMVVGFGFAFARFLAPAFFKKETREIDKEVIRKVAMLGGIMSGNLLIPFVTTIAIGALTQHAKQSVAEAVPAVPKPKLNIQDSALLDPAPDEKNTVTKLNTAKSKDAPFKSNLSNLNTPKPYSGNLNNKSSKNAPYPVTSLTTFPYFASSYPSYSFGRGLSL